MIIKTTKDQIIISFEKRDWNCGRADNVIHDIKVDISPKLRDYNPLNKEWTLTRSVVVDELWAEIHKRHVFDPNQQTMFGIFDQQEAAWKERRPVGASDDPRPRMEKACERLSEPPEPERARAFWCLPPAPFFGYLYKQQSYEGDNFNVTFATNLHRLKRRYSVSGE